MAVVQSVARDAQTVDPNAVKASFDDIYLRDDPRDYFSVLGSLDYSIPDLARPIIRQIASAWRKETGRAATILDLGSSYGINAALFRYPLTFDMLRRRYARREMLQLSGAETRALDRNYFRSWPRVQAERLIAADVSAPAIAYAVEAGLVDDGIVHDFERGRPDDAACAKLNGVDILFSTGCVGYVTERTFDAILDCSARAPWVVSFVLRMFDYRPIEDALSKRGLVTEKLGSAAFVQRRFRDETEAGEVIGVLKGRGLDPAGLEAEGLFYAELFVSRPPEAIAAASLEEIVTVASGSHLSFGPRFLHVSREGRPSLVPARS